MSKEKFLKTIDSEINTTVDVLFKKLESCRINVLEYIPPPETAWELKDSHTDEFYILGTHGNFSLVKGKAKSKKSFFINMAISSAVGEGMLQNRLRSPLKQNYNEVLYFDTEQSRYHVQKAVQRICDQIKIKLPPNLKTYGLRKENPAERLKLIEFAIENTENLGFVVIDGIRDLITSINDEIESTHVASKLLKWTELYNIHIIVVLHENPGSDKARGHIGTELTNKAETVISIEVDKSNPNISVALPSCCRNKAFEPFAFEINDCGLPQIIYDYEGLTKNSKNSFDLMKLANPEKFQILKETYANEDEFAHGDLVSQIKNVVDKNYLGTKGKGENKIKDLITQAKNEGWLMQLGNRKPYTIGKLPV